jgi:hypothetical protein
LQQHVVEGQAFAESAIGFFGRGLCHCQLYLSAPVFSSFAGEFWGIAVGGCR